MTHIFLKWVLNVSITYHFSPPLLLCINTTMLFSACPDMLYNTRGRSKKTGQQRTKAIWREGGKEPKEGEKRDRQRNRKGVWKSRAFLPRQHRTKQLAAWQKTKATYMVAGSRSVELRQSVPVIGDLGSATGAVRWAIRGDYWICQRK